jgi:hypothetical protein
MIKRPSNHAQQTMHHLGAEATGNAVITQFHFLDWCIVLLDPVANNVLWCGNIEDHAWLKIKHSLAPFVPSWFCFIEIVFKWVEINRNRSNVLKSYSWDTLYVDTLYFERHFSRVCILFKRQSACVNILLFSKITFHKISLSWFHMDKNIITHSGLIQQNDVFQDNANKSTTASHHSN